MCHAIAVVKYRVGETAQVKIETAGDVAERVEGFEANPEVLEYRIYWAAGKRVRTTVWEDQA